MTTHCASVDSHTRQPTHPQPVPAQLVIRYGCVHEHVDSCPLCMDCWRAVQRVHDLYSLICIICDHRCPVHIDTQPADQPRETLDP